MSSGADDIVAAQARMMCCASCGKSEVDDIKLVPCYACDLVRYCSDECQANHRLEHEAKCKERAVALRDKILFRQPECKHLGDCPILQVMALSSSTCHGRRTALLQCKCQLCFVSTLLQRRETFRSETTTSHYCK